MVFQWVINGVLIIINKNGRINSTEMPLTLHHFLSKLKTEMKNKWSKEMEIKSNQIF